MVTCTIPPRRYAVRLNSGVIPPPEIDLWRIGHLLPKVEDFPDYAESQSICYKSDATHPSLSPLSSGALQRF
jgi:hypothetical protein